MTELEVGIHRRAKHDSATLVWSIRVRIHEQVNALPLREYRVGKLP